MSRILFTGIMPALVSPVNEDGTIREKQLRHLVRDLSQTGITGFYLCGATGEGIAMAPERRMELVEIVKDEAPEGMKLINHIGAGDLATVKRLARHSRAIGLDGISSVPPFFFNYDERGIIDYYRAMSEESEALPLLIYASPLSGAPLPVKTVEKMLGIPGFVGMKYTNPNYYLMSRYKKLAGGDINIINGPDETCMLGLLMGADAAIGSTYNVMPRLFVSIYNAVKSGRIDEARPLQMKADDLIELMLGYDIVSCCKLMLDERGYDIGETNAPMKRLTDAQKADFLDELNALGGVDAFS
ncbi:MAG: dihydrodipicolinate synthase family protein [Clostridia bacterium]|nr:dihydrodipicolinate synthase family protein [Clostridia bacterium]MBO4886417.1 dihydrodipicolinate synthase family protein [Clostridia bacterium]